MVNSAQHDLPATTTIQQHLTHNAFQADDTVLLGHQRQLTVNPISDLVTPTSTLGTVTMMPNAGTVNILTGPTLTGQALTGPTLTGQALTGPTLTGPTSTDQALTGPTLTGPTLTGPTLTGPTLTGPTLTGPTLTGPTLTGPTLTGPTLTGPTLTGQALTGPPTNETNPAVVATTSIGMLTWTSVHLLSTRY